MENKTHIEIAKLYCKKTNLNSHRTKIIIESTMQPDEDANYINLFLQKLFSKNSKFENLAEQYKTVISPNIHSHKYVPDACIFFARLSNELDDIKLKCEALGWSIHYFVDCATPIHENSLRAFWDYLNGRHEKYEKYIDKYYLKHFKTTCEQGFGIGINDKSNFTLASAKSLATNSSNYYNNITSALNNKNYQKLNDTTHNVFLLLGENFARFVNTFNDK